MRINCQTCKGLKGEVISNDIPKELSKAYPLNHIKYEEVTPCPSCNGKGFYTVKRL